MTISATGENSAPKATVNSGTRSKEPPVAMPATQVTVTPIEPGARHEPMGGATDC